MWVVDCHKFEILYGQTSFHEPDSLEYRAIVKRHECEPSLHVPRDLFPTALSEKSFKEAMNAAKAELRIYPLSKVDRHPGSLAFRPKNITAPIFAKATGTTCLINYMSPGEYFPKGGVSFEVFLPEPPFESIGSLIERAMFSGTIGMRVVIGDFNWFLEKPADWSEFQVPTQDQFLSTDTNQIKPLPYVCRDLLFRFGSNQGPETVFHP